MLSNRLRTMLRVAAVLLLVGVATTWVATGAHRGWTKTEITTMAHDEITGIDYPVQRDGFVAGLDFVAAGAGLAALLAGVSFAVGRRQSAA
jgi:hypothetical protein